MQAVPAHAVPAGPLAVRWIAYELEPPQAGALGRARIELENAGAAPWRELFTAYHWLDDLGNAIDWDGLRTPLPPLPPGGRTEATLAVRAVMPPGRYRLAFDLVLEHRSWLSEIGNAMLEVDVDVGPRDASGRVAHLPPEVEPAADWHELTRAAHEEGFAAVGGSLDAGRDRDLQAYRPGGGRNPSFTEPLVCPSLLLPLAPNCTVAGLPAWRPEGAEPWIYDARITARLRSGRRRG
jgi:hypothetical protein